MASGHSPVTDPVMRAKGYLLIAEAARKIDVTPQTISRCVSDERKPVVGLREGYRRYVLWESLLAHYGPEVCEIRGLHADDVKVETGINEG